MQRRSLRPRKSVQSLVDESYFNAPATTTRKARRPQQRSPPGTTVVASSRQARNCTPCRSDVLMGRGKRIESHPGNKQFHQTVDASLSGYMSLTTRNEKHAYTLQVVAQMKFDGVRFLERDDAHHDQWHEVGDQTARIKVAQQLRYRQRRRVEKDETVAAARGLLEQVGSGTNLAPTTADANETSDGQVIRDFENAAAHWSDDAVRSDDALSFTTVGTVNVEDIV